MINLFKKMLGAAEKTDWKSLCANGAVIVDVRSPGEFKAGHVKGAINVPLQNLPREVDALKKFRKPIITCCLSGSRSGVAKSVLEQYGLEVYNGGSWFSLQNKI